MRSSIMKISIYTMLLCILMSFGFAIPTGPRSITGEIDYRLLPYGAPSNDAIAGNITEINMNAWSVTRTWQGYFGNITGTIVLGDQNNATLYDWTNTNPNGRVYAARVDSIDWTTIACADKATILDGTEATFTLTATPDRNGNIPIDSVNNTFTISTDNMRTDGVTSRLVQHAVYDRFWVGPVQINGTTEPNECYSTVLHNATGWVEGDQSAGNNPDHWREVLLADGSGLTNIVYTAILEQDYVGFDGKAHDFEMLVGENGHGTDVSTTPYFFYVELE